MKLNPTQTFKPSPDLRWANTCRTCKEPIGSMGSQGWWHVGATTIRTTTGHKVQVPVPVASDHETQPLR